MSHHHSNSSLYDNWIHHNGCNFRLPQFKIIVKWHNAEDTSEILQAISSGPYVVFCADIALDVTRILGK